MKALPFYLTLEEPLLAPALNGDPNSAVSYPFIPGTLIRGAVATRLAAKVSDLAVNERDRLFNGHTRFLNAYPVVSLKTKDEAQALPYNTLPVPLSWQQAKKDVSARYVYDLSSAANEVEHTRGVSKPFYFRRNDKLVFHSPDRQLNVHTHRENRMMGRATETEGGVFRYEALAAGQKFWSVVLFDDEVDEALFNQGQMLLGGSRTTAYGRVIVEPGSVVEAWRELGGQAGAIAPGDLFTVTLLSDLIMQDNNGQYTSHVTNEMFDQWLGSPVAIQKAFTATTIVGGFNRKWGLPLAQTPALQMGSVFVLKAKANIPADTVRQIEWAGLGHRRAEGFGRIFIAPVDPQLAKFEVYPKKQLKEEMTTPNNAPAVTTLPDKDSQNMAEMMYQRLLQFRVETAIAQYVHQPGLLNPNGISPNQLSRMRVQVRGHLGGEAKDAPDALLEWLGKFRSTGRKQYEQAGVGGQSLLDWLKAHLGSPDISPPVSVWNTLAIDLDDLPLAQIVAVADIKSDEITNQTTLRLIDGVLAKMAKLAKKEQVQEAQNE